MGAANMALIRGAYSPLPTGKPGTPELDTTTHAYTHDRRAWVIAAALGLARREVREMAHEQVRPSE